MDETDIVQVLLRRAADGDNVSAVAAAELRRLRGIAGRAARSTRQSRDMKDGRKALNPKMRINTRGLPLHEKIKARTVEDKATGCWVWQGQCCNGYGRIRRCGGADSKGALCHRLMYQHYHGPIPERHVVMHTCDNRRCVNPAHLKSATQKENIRDMHSKGRSTRTILSPEEVKEIRAKHATGSGIDKLAAEFGVGNYTIHKIVSGRSWSWL